jgi:hypothetical protein
VLDDARAKAADIILATKAEISALHAESLPVDEVKRDCAKIVSDAELEAEKVVEEAAKKAAKIKDAVKKKIDKIVDKVANTITGVQS